MSKRRKRTTYGDALVEAAKAIADGRVDEVVEVRSFSRYYDDRVIDGKFVKTGHETTTTARTIWKRPR
jgi:hypothetical protein